MIYIGIDPDIRFSGFAIWSSEKKELELTNLDFWHAIQMIKTLHSTWQENLKVIIEGGWLNKKSNWHAAQGSRAEKIAKDVGKNHQVGILMAEFCERHEISYEVVKPLNLIKGKKMDAKTFNSITGYNARSNQETRDAALLVFGRK